MARTLTLTDLKDPREVAFVQAVFELGGPHFGADAAVRAGYTDDPREAQRIATILLAGPRISKAIAGETAARFDAATATAFNTILAVCIDPKSPASAKITAAQEILSRSSIGPIPSRSMSLVAKGTVEELLDRLDAADAGTDAETIDAEFRAK